jgi:hypothetical protein
VSDEETASLLRAIKEQLNRIEMRQVEIVERLMVITPGSFASNE